MCIVTSGKDRRLSCDTQEQSCVVFDNPIQRRKKYEPKNFQKFSLASP
ncbi:hypothetical protein M23134_03732 [Microscilla marina ATCC 23134]|uniref:Uncharacterized protein n=1 Tax=Microscilla marina ATCC 23134 TaxID=313606 RepID=A1ZPC5_MICM2|nr:hypothetical protein M23134_03732 [Microscilla marina ATCC 23134]